ncbi:hypothetical protein LTR56_003045 [Elasticomyces elasticus]|nr:hypothetical protein LTR56_003045 [Elasticomyces elasticus]KAK3662107.1 hypothetical protein LTR22_007080 [Elasticomyces elasticus]KAK4927530.1 hypothetical protein LTR49_005670 [Elasticomyces elasticus]KAK5743696.1 hypothetical protein LTS12_023777 [Elasticomyces elasticus]
MATDAKQMSEEIPRKELTLKEATKAAFEPPSCGSALLILCSLNSILNIMKSWLNPPHFNNPKFGPPWLQQGAVTFVYVAVQFHTLDAVRATFKVLQAKYGGFFDTRLAMALKILLCVTLPIAAFLGACWKMDDLQHVWCIIGWY